MADNDNWYDGIAPESEENTALRETLSGYDDAGAFFTAHNEMANADWRDPYAMDADGKVDDKFKATLQRFSTPADAGKAYREAQQTISAGKQLQPLPEGANEDDVKAYREANGIPLESKGYLENLPDGLILGENDGPIAEVFMAALHETNAPPAVAHALIAKYNTWSEEVQDARAELDSDQAAEATKELREMWGSDYRANHNMVGAFLETTFGKEAKEQFENGRFMDGTAFMNNPKVLAGIAEIQRRLDPLTAHVPPGGDPTKTVDDELAEIDKYRRENRDKYFKDEKMQARERQLIDLKKAHDKVAA